MCNGFWTAGAGNKPVLHDLGHLTRWYHVVILIWLLTAAIPSFARSRKPKVCQASADLLSQEHLTIRAKLDQVSAVDGWALQEALKYWAGVLDLDWKQDNDLNTCNLELLYTTEQTARIAYTIMPHAIGFDGAIYLNTTYRTPANRLAEVALLIHELGHVFGLVHNPDLNSVMNYRNESASGAAGRLTAADIERVGRMHALRQPDALSHPLAYSARSGASQN